MITRRHIIQGAAATRFGGILGGGVAWSTPGGGVRAILPSATHDTLAIKVLLDLPATAAPELRIAGRAVKPQRMDIDGYAWGFVQRAFTSGTSHTLSLAYALRSELPLALPRPPPALKPMRFSLLQMLDFMKANGSLDCNQTSDRPPRIATYVVVARRDFVSPYQLVNRLPV